uniref:Retrovirus-related Pol polyprotein from transposon TNT 1-94 n=1 Tax=Nicotiana tabacum TaxID=4097 RepID=A0A1S3WYN9_TOBAC|nr:PREDICTED: uncharacterized protein LOC107759292 [Nicotiana tabacum]
MNVSTSTQIPNIVLVVEEYFDNTGKHLDEILHEETNSQISNTNEPQEMPLRKSQRVRKSAISDDYVVYLQESDFDIALNKDPVSFSQAIESNESEKWIDAMKEDLKSMEYNKIRTRPDISFAVGMLGRYQSNPGIDHWKAAKKVLRYLKEMKDYMLIYRRSKLLEVVGYSDSDFTGYIDTRKSTFGYLFQFAEGAISWRVPNSLSLLHPRWK